MNNYIIVALYIFLFIAFKLFNIANIKKPELIKRYFIVLLIVVLLCFLIDFPCRIYIIVTHIALFIFNAILRRVHYSVTESKNLIVWKEFGNLSTEVISKNFKQYNKKIKNIVVKSDLTKVENSVIIINDFVKFKAENIMPLLITNEIYIKFSYDVLPLYQEDFFLIDDMPYIKIKKIAISKPNLFIKRLFDIIFSLILLVLLIPLNLIIAIFIKLTSPGGILYKQERITLNNKKFTIYKFRSMYIDAEKDGVPLISFKGDERITPIGRFIRKSKLDEIPQLFNVLKGDMSLIGPRPEREYYVNKYIHSIPFYNLRHNVKAGITGLGHIYGNYYTSPEYRYIYDLYYIMNYSLYLDLKITVKTLFKIILMV